MFCPNCGNQVEDGSRFCLYCGNRFGDQPEVPVQQPVAQVYTTEENDAFFAQVEQTPAVYPAQKKPVKLPNIKLPDIKLPDFKKIPKKFLLIGCGAVAALILVIILIAALSSSGGELSYALYVKDGQMFYHDISGKEARQVTEDLTDGEDMENYDLIYIAGSVESAIHLTEDGKTIFYLDEVGDSGKLFYRSLTNFKKEPVQIASGVEQYYVCKDGKQVIFLKNGTLYRYDMKEDEKIAKNVENFSASVNGDVIYENEDGVWYFIFNGKEEKLGSEIDICYITEKGVAYYQDEDKVYRKPFGKDKEKLASDVNDVFGFTEDGTFYFTRSEEVTMADFFKDNAEYEYWMQSLKEYEFTPYYGLYYFNGKEEALLTEGCTNRQNTYSDDGLAVFYSQYDLSTMEKLSYQKLEELCSSDEYYYVSVYDVALIMLEEALDKSAAECVCIDGTVTQLETENVQDAVYSPDGKTMYLLCEVDEEEETGTLMKASVSGKKVGKPEPFDEDVCSDRGCYFVGSSDYFIYFKDVENREGELFVNGVSVAEDVYINMIRYNAQDNELLYMVDFDTDKSEGTLCVFNGKKSGEIADDVSRYAIGPNGDVAFLYDYNSSKWEGSLAVYNGKVIEVAEDVHSYTFTPAGDLLFLYDYNNSKFRGSLGAFTGRKVKELDEDVVALITVREGSYHYYD